MGPRRSRDPFSPDSCGRNPCAGPGGLTETNGRELRAWREGGFLFATWRANTKIPPGFEDQHECTDVELLNTPQTAFIGRRSCPSMVKPHRVILIS